MESIFFNPWIWILPLLLAASLAVMVIGIVRVVREDYSFWLFGIVFGGLGVLVLSGVYFGAVLPPYDASYYHTYRVAGEIESLERPFEGGEGVATSSFVVEVAGVALAIRSDDQRFRLLEKGEDVTLVCTKQFVYFVDPWLDCSLGSWTNQQNGSE